MNKKISEEIMKRPSIGNKLFNTKCSIDGKACNKRRNLCVSLIGSEKKIFCSNIDMSDITDTKTFWKTVKPFFTDKIKTKCKITVTENTENKIISLKGQEKIVSEEIITEDQAVAEVFKNFFINIVPNLKIFTYHAYDHDFIATDDQVTNAANKFRNCPSIIMIKKHEKILTLQKKTLKNKNPETKFSKFCRIYLKKYQPVYLKINIPVGFEISWCNASL